MCFNSSLQQDLLNYCEENDIKTGPIFVKKDGTIFDKSSVMIKIKKLSKDAGIDKKRISIHSFRNLYIENEYKKQKENQALDDVNYDM